MADKPIISIELDDSAFSEFKRKFDEYESAVKEMPRQWQLANSEITVQKTKIEKLSALASGVYNSLERATIAQSASSRLIEASGTALMGMARGGKQFAAHIKQATASLRHWTKLTGLLFGALTAGGLFGIGRLAESVARQRSSATGLGVSYGEQTSFLVNFGRLGDTEGILRGFSEAETDVSKKYALRQYLGHAESGDPAKDFTEGLLRFKQLVDRTPQEILEPTLRARGYDKLGIGIETARIIRGTSQAELEQLSRSYGADLATRLGLPEADVKAWVKFTEQIERSGNEINTAFDKGLAKLTKPLTHLSDSFVRLTENLLKEGGPISAFIKDLGHGIQKFAEELGSGEVHDRTARIARDIGDTIKLVDAIIAKAPRGLAVLAGIAVGSRFGGAAAAAGAALGRMGLGTLGTSAVAAGALGATVYPQPLNAGEDERARQRQFGHGGGTGGRLPTGIFPNYAPARPGSLSGKPAISFDRTSATNQGKAVDFAMTKIGETINDQDIQTYLKTGGHPNPGKAAWCAMFVGASLTKAGIRDSGSNVATSYEQWGVPVDPRDVHKGDVYVKTRGHAAGETGGHVGLLTGNVRFVHGREQVEMISGNSAHQVRRTWELTGGANVIRRAADGMVKRGSKFGHPHIGHHPATKDRAERHLVVYDNTGGLVTIGAH